MGALFPWRAALFSSVARNLRLRRSSDLAARGPRGRALELPVMGAQCFAGRDRDDTEQANIVLAAAKLLPSSGETVVAHSTHAKLLELLDRAVTEALGARRMLKFCVVASGFLCN